jgi:hypothetical protein
MGGDHTAPAAGRLPDSDPTGGGIEIRIIFAAKIHFYYRMIIARIKTKGAITAPFNSFLCVRN